MDRDVVFIDTCVFIAENYFSKENRIMALNRLAKKGRISIVMPLITKEEIVIHFCSDIKKAYKSFTKECKLLRNLDSLDDLCRSCTEKTFVELANKKFNQFITSTQAYEIGYEYCSDAESVFSKYFNKSKPFGEGKKKSEFPDAFTLQSLEEYCKRTGLKKIIVLTSDSDLKNYESLYIEPVDYKEYVNRLLVLDNDITDFEKALYDNIGFFKDQIKDEVEEFLNNENTYRYIVGMGNMPSISIVDCNVNSDLSTYVTDITDDKIVAELIFDVSFSVDLEYQDMEYGYYDKEDDCWYGEIIKEENVEREKEIKTVLTFERGQKDEAKIEITSSDIEVVMDYI